MNLETYKFIRSNLIGTCLVAVSKKHSVEKIMALYNEGHRDFGENFIQELVEKRKQLPKDINWHFLGNIQTNKIKLIAQHSSLIQSVGRTKVYNHLLKTGLEKEIKILLQLKLGHEDTKSGLTEKEIIRIIEHHPEDSNVKVCGLMGITENNISETERAEQFDQCNNLYSQIRATAKNVEILSLGMSNDWEGAIKHGSTMIRIGTKIFGERK
ncbi:MAG: YggS family pyridoxal phosphate-dependent enzyme [Gammaproteobacteria bacterium]